MSEYGNIGPAIEKSANDLGKMMANELNRMLGPRVEYVPLAGWKCPQCLLKTDPEGYCACGRNLGTRVIWPTESGRP